MSTLEERYEAIRARVPAGVKLVAVSKTRSVEEIQALYDLGQRAFGENYPRSCATSSPRCRPTSNGTSSGTCRPTK